MGGGLVFVEFYLYARIKGKYLSILFFHQRYSDANIRNYQCTNLQNYTTVHPLLLTQILIEKGA
jgi:hypothetical protein